MFARPRVMVAPFGFAFNQHQPTVCRMATNVSGIVEGLGARRGIRKNLGAALPWTFGNTDPVFATDASDPRPMMFRDQVEPGRVKTGIGDEGRSAPVGQQLRQTIQKPTMHRLITIPSLRVNFLVQRHTAALDGDAGTQQMPALIGRGVRPIDHHPHIIEIGQPT